MNLLEGDPPRRGAKHPRRNPDDPTDGGKLCGARRSRRQIALAMERGEDPWPWCRKEAGWGTDHVGIGTCRLHWGNHPSARRSAQLKLARLVEPAIANLGRVLANRSASDRDKIRAAAEVLDRAGVPRRAEVDVESSRELLEDRLAAWLTAEDDDEDEDD